MREVSINIPFFNRLDTLSRCIKSIEENTPRDLYELVLINDGSTDAEAVDYAKSHADIFVNHDDVSGIATSRADGVNVSTCKYICTCDSDIVVPPKWLQTLLRTFKMDHLHPNLDKRQPSHRFITHGVDVKILAPLLYGRVGQYIWAMNKCTPNWVLLVGEVGTYCMMFEKSLINLIGNFDTNLFNIWEDLDFCRRISQNVFDLPNNPIVALDTRVIVYHHGWCDPQTGIYYGEPKSNTRDLVAAVVRENREKMIKVAKAIKLLNDRWGVKHGIYDRFMEVLTQNGIDTEKPLCESWANKPMYKFKPLEMATK